MIGVGHEAQRHREAAEQDRPRVQVEHRPALAEADAAEAVVEVVGVGAVDRAAVLHPLEHHERRVQEGHGQHDEREEQGQHGLGLDRALHRDAAQQQPEQVRARVAHVDRRRMEVVDQEAQRRAGGDGGQAPPAWLRSRSKAMIAKVIALIAQTPAASPSTPSEKLTTFITATRPTTVSGPPASPKSTAPTNGQRDVGDLDARRHGDHGGDDLARELDHRRQVEAVVEGADERDDHRAGQDPLEAIRRRPARSRNRARAQRARRRASPARRAAASPGAAARARWARRPRRRAARAARSAA